MKKIFLLSCFALLLTACAMSPVDMSINATSPYRVHDGKVTFVERRYRQKSKEHEISSADAPSFSAIGRTYYARDSSYVYFKGKPIPFAKPDSFKVIENFYTHDSDNVYYKAGVLEHANAENLELFTVGVFGRYARSGEYIYHDDRALKACDSRSYKVLKRYSNWSYDKKCSYFKGVLLEGVTPSEMDVLNNSYAVTANNIIYRGKVVANADPKTFELVERQQTYDARDKLSCYNDGTAVACENKPAKSLASMTVKEAKAYGYSLAKTAIDKKIKHSESIIDKMPATISRVREKAKKSMDLLNPESASAIDLTELKPGFYIELVSSVSKRYNQTQILTLVKEDSAVFDLYSPFIYGVLSNTQGLDGRVKQQVTPGILNLVRDYQTDCFWQLGSCEQVYYLKVLGASDQVKEPQKVVINTEYEEGVWTSTYTDSKGAKVVKKSIFDRYGLPLYQIKYKNDHLYHELIRKTLL